MIFKIVRTIKVMWNRVTGIPWKMHAVWSVVPI